jgi:hypothetical protein
MTVGVGGSDLPIYRVDIPGAAWALLWWLLCEMDESCMVNGGWRTRAAESMGRDRIWIGRSAQTLLEHGLISTEANARWVKVNVKAIRA